jgi:hypothetical protein
MSARLSQMQTTPRNIQVPRVLRTLKLKNYRLPSDPGLKIARILYFCTALSNKKPAATQIFIKYPGPVFCPGQALSGQKALS